MSEELKKYLETFWSKDENRDINFIREYNKNLISKYPWLKVQEYDGYDFTWLDDMPEGWRIAFGEQMCEDIQKELERVDFVDKYKILQIKEKFGGLRWYDSSIPQNSILWDIIAKYEVLSYKTCIICGAPATWVTTGWISPFCDECLNTIIDENARGVRAVPVKEFYRDE